MKKIMPFVLVGILLFSGFGAGGLSNYESLENEISCFTVDKESISVTIHVGPYEIKNIEDRQELFVNDFGRLSTPGNRTYHPRYLLLQFRLELRWLMFYMMQAKE